MISQEIKKLLVESANKTKSSWAIVRDGVVAEFSIVQGDKLTKIFQNDVLHVDTQRAALCINFDDSLEAIVSESGAYGCSPWTQNIYLCVKKEGAEMARRIKLTHLGKFDDYDIQGNLWDLGVGNDTLDACIIATNESVNELLKQNEGQYVIDNSKFLQELVRYSPPRLFKTKFASILVKQKIPTAEEEIEGPHTHLLPPIIKSKKHFVVPVPDDVIPVIQVDPFGSVMDGNGEFYKWHGFENDEFQNFMRKYGNQEYVTLKSEMKKKIIDCLRNNDQTPLGSDYANKSRQDLIRVILAQIVCDDKLDVFVRKEALSLLENLKTINLKGLKQWVQQMAPEIQN
ncbi:MAG: hypothetical protein ABI337_07375 [Nitrososphaera sp.]|jgi:hypothetical protein